MIKRVEGNINTKGLTIVTGDLNCPYVKWKNGSVSSNLVSLQLYNFAMANGFIQAVDEPIRGNNIIDLVLINEPFCCHLTPLNHHLVQVTTILSTSLLHFIILLTAGPQSSQRRYLRKQGDYTAMSHYLRNFDWSYMMLSLIHI